MASSILSLQMGSPVKLPTTHYIPGVLFLLILCITPSVVSGEFTGNVFAVWGAQVQPPPPPPTTTTPGSGGPKCLRGPDHCTSEYGEIHWHHRRQKILVPHLKGPGKPITPCVSTQHAQLFVAIFSGPPRRGSSTMIVGHGLAKERSRHPYEAPSCLPSHLDIGQSALSCCFEGCNQHEASKYPFPECYFALIPEMG